MKLQGSAARSPAQQENGTGPGAHTSRPTYPLCRCLGVGGLLGAAAAAVADAASDHADASGTAAAAATAARTARLHHLFFITTRNIMTIIYTARF